MNLHTLHLPAIPLRETEEPPGWGVIGPRLEKVTRFSVIKSDGS